jgi:hypothetical protein
MGRVHLVHLVKLRKNRDIISGGTVKYPMVEIVLATRVVYLGSAKVIYVAKRLTM